mmetsp:Transcript_32121/g.51709  ORF Transcript_32121/g.51709 Transcript_32121/m.51709 type:complete len:453 (-) Transcript_32121:188-1546(-)
MLKSHANIPEPMNPAKKLSPVHTLEGHESLINSCSFSKDGNLVVSSSADGTVRLWHANSGQQLASFEGHDGMMVQNCAFIPSAKQCLRHLKKIEESDCEEETEEEEEEDQPLVISASDEDIKLWGAHDGKEKGSMEIECDGMLQGFALSPDGRKIISNMDDQCIILSTIGETKAVSLRGHEGAAKSFCFSSDGEQILTSSTDGSVKLWDSDSGDEILDFKGHSESVLKAVFSPDNARILSCSADMTLRLWERLTGKQMAVLDGHGSEIHLCNFSPNGRWIASASKDKDIKIWNAETHEEIATLRGHKSFVWSIQFSPNSMLLLSTACDGSMLLWALPHGELLGSLQGHTEGVKSCSFSPGGKALVSSSHDNTLMLWNMTGCAYEGYIDEMGSFIDSRTKRQFPRAVCSIIADYAWPTAIGDLDIEDEYCPQQQPKTECNHPVYRRRVKSCKF